MPKFEPKSDTFPDLSGRDKDDMKLVRSEWWILQENWQRDDYSGGMDLVSSVLVYGPYDSKEETQEHCDILNADKSRTRFGYKFRPRERHLYEYTARIWV